MLAILWDGILSSLALLPFLLFGDDRIWIANEYAIAFPDANPVTDGHTLVAPRKHVSSVYELTIPEARWAELALRTRLCHRSEERANALLLPCCYATRGLGAQRGPFWDLHVGPCPTRLLQQRVVR